MESISRDWLFILYNLCNSHQKCRVVTNNELAIDIKCILTAVILHTHTHKLTITLTYIHNTFHCGAFVVQNLICDLHQQSHKRVEKHIVKKKLKYQHQHKQIHSLSLTFSVTLIVIKPYQGFE